MRRSFAIAFLHLTSTFKSKGAVMTMLGMPLLLTLIFGVLTASGGVQGNAKGAVYPIAIVDLDNGSFASRTLTDLLKAEPNLTVRTATAAETDKLAADYKIVASVVIPAGFQADLTTGKQPDVTFVTAPNDTGYLGAGPFVRRALPRLAQDYQLALQAVPDKADSAKVEAAYAKIAEARAKASATVKTTEVTRIEVAKTGMSAANHASVGFTVTFVMMQVLMMSGVILTERKNGTWGRLLTTPNSKVTIMAGYLLSFFLTGMAQFAILVLATRFLFNVSWGPLLPIFALGACTVLAAAGMGLFLAGLVKTQEQQASVGLLFVNATAMLGGAYWDLDFVSETMRRIGYMTPQAWAITGFKEVMLRGGSWEAILLPLTVLLGISVVFTTAGLMRVRYE